MLIAITILLILAELRSKVQLLISFWWTVRIIIGLNLLMAIVVVFIGNSDFLD